MAAAPTLPQSVGNFDLLKRVKVKYGDVVISRWQSRVSGLTLVHIDYQAPIVSGYFVVRSEIFNDSGCPHTLEHLVFMGSEKYPYKGVLDNLATRGFADGTNAWTANDHTCYTISTAGGQGFLQLLPVYVDHILYPTMTKSSFVTEVHHVDPEGRDAGVVYSEMQARENTPGDLSTLQLQRLSNPEGSAYRSETGGLMEALRVLTVDDIRKYHSEYYVPHNLSLIVSGKVDTRALLDALQTHVEPSAIAHGQTHGPRGPPGFARPFVGTPSANRPPHAETVKHTTEFPERDESMGEVYISFRGSKCGDFITNGALDIIGSYLTSTATSPLNRDLVEIPSPLCAQIWMYETDRAAVNDYDLGAASVPTEELENFDEKVIESLKKVVADGIDMTRLSQIIERDRRKLLASLESKGGEIFADTLIADFLYFDEKGADLEEQVNDLEQYDALAKWTEQQWKDLIQTYFIDSHRIVVRAKPSSTLQEKLESDESTRVAAQVEKLGADGLKRLAGELEQAKTENDKPVPQEMLTCFPVPDVKTISWIPVTSAQNVGKGKVVPAPGGEGLAKHIAADGCNLPVFLSFHQIPSKFFSIDAYISLARLPDELRPLLAIYAASFLSLPVTRSDGTHMTYDQVVNALDNETVVGEASVGLDGSFPQMFIPGFKVEADRYESQIVWLKDLLFSSHFDVDRLRVITAKILQGLPELKRDGSKVASSVLNSLLQGPASNTRALHLEAQMEHIPRIAQQLQDDPEAVVRDLETIRKYVTDPAALRFVVWGDIASLPKPREIWHKTFGESKDIELLPVPLRKDTLSDLGKNPARKAVVITMPTIESTFSTFVTKTVNTYDHADIPALAVAIEVMNALESFLWKAIRGSGLAYGASLSLDVEQGVLKFSLYRSPNSFLAYSTGAEVVRNVVNGTTPIEQTTIDSAKSSLVYSVARSVSSPGKAALMSFTNQVLKSSTQDRHLKMLQRYQEITREQVLDALRKYVLPVFDPATSIVVSSCGPAVADKVAEGLKSVGYDVESRLWDAGADEGGEDGHSDCDTCESGSSA